MSGKKNYIDRPCRCAICGQLMVVGEEFEWHHRKVTTHRAANTGMPSRRTIIRPSHPRRINCLQPDWTMPGGGYDKHIASQGGTNNAG